jgi:hypothetical protein
MRPSDASLVRTGIMPNTPRMFIQPTHWKCWPFHRYSAQAMKSVAKGTSPISRQACSTSIVRWPKADHIRNAALIATKASST